MPSTFDFVLCLHVYKDLGPLIQSIIFWRMWEGGGAGKRGWNVEMLSFLFCLSVFFFFFFFFVCFFFFSCMVMNNRALTIVTPLQRQH